MKREIHRYSPHMMIFLMILLLLIASLWVWLALSPVHAWAFRYPINAETDITGECRDLVASADRAPWPQDAWPAVTLIVPARNEAPVLESTLPTLCHQDYPDARVILIDDQGRIKLSRKEAMKELGESDPEPVGAPGGAGGGSEGGGDRGPRRDDRGPRRDDRGPRRDDRGPRRN